MFSVGIAAVDRLQLGMFILLLKSLLSLVFLVLLALMHAVAGFHAVAGILTVAGAFLCSVSVFSDVHAVARILEDVAIPFVADIPAVDGFSTIVSILPSPLPTFRNCRCCCFGVCSCERT